MTADPIAAAPVTAFDTRVDLGGSDTFTRWDVTVDSAGTVDSVAEQTRMAVVSLPNGYIVGRLEERDPEDAPGVFTFNYATDDTLRDTYTPSFDDSSADHGMPDFHYNESTKPMSGWVTDARIGSKIVYTFAYKGRGYFVTGTSDESFVMVLTYDPEWGVLGAFKLTLGAGLTATGCQWFFDETRNDEGRIRPQLHYIQASVTSSFGVGKVDLPDVSEGVSYPTEVTGTSATRTFTYKTLLRGQTGYSEDTSERDHMSLGGFWFASPWGGWEHRTRRVWKKTGESSKVQTQLTWVDFSDLSLSTDWLIYAGFLPLYFHQTPFATEYTGPTYSTLDDTTYRRVGPNLYMSYGETGWEFWQFHDDSHRGSQILGSPTDPETVYVDGYWYTYYPSLLENYDPNSPLHLVETIPYPFTPSNRSDAVLPAINDYQYDAQGSLIVGPVAADDSDNVHLFTLRMRHRWAFADEPPLDVYFESFNTDNGFIYDHGLTRRDVVECNAYAFRLDSDTDHEIRLNAFSGVVPGDMALSVTRPPGWRMGAADAPFGFAAVTSYITHSPHAGDDAAVAYDQTAVLWAALGKSGDGHFDDVTARGGPHFTASVELGSEGGAVDVNLTVGSTLHFSASAEPTLLVPEVDVTLHPTPLHFTTLLPVAPEAVDDMSFRGGLSFRSKVRLLTDTDLSIESDLTFDAAVSLSVSWVLEPLELGYAPPLRFTVGLTLSEKGVSTGTPPDPTTGAPPAPVTPGPTEPGDGVSILLPPGTSLPVELTYVVDGEVVLIVHDGEVVETVFVPGGDLSGLVLHVYVGGVNVTATVTVVYATPAYALDTSFATVDKFLWDVSQHFIGDVEIGVNLFIDGEDAVSCVWDYASSDLTDKRVVYLFGYESPQLSFADASLIAQAGFGRYLRAS